MLASCVKKLIAHKKPHMVGGRSFWMGTSCGTQGYTPEVANGKVIPKVDYAFGIVSEFFFFNPIMGIGTFMSHVRPR